MGWIPTAAARLREVREQIGECFGATSCYLLPHPGFAVTQKTYDGRIARIRRPFRVLLARYVERVFTTQLPVVDRRGKHFLSFSDRNGAAVHTATARITHSR